MGARAKCWNMASLGVSAYFCKAHTPSDRSGAFGAIFACERPPLWLFAIGGAGLVYYLFARARAWWHHG